MPSTRVSKNKDPYQKFLKAIRFEMAKGVRNVEKLLERQKVLTYWAIGRRINEYVTRNNLPQGAITSFYQRLSEDIDIHLRTLQHFEQFFRYFPKFKYIDGINWSHYRFLLVIPDQEERLRWIQRIQKERMTSNELHRRLSLAHDEPAEDIDENLKDPGRGKLYTYPLRHADGLEGVDGEWFVDCGFSNRMEAPKSEATLDNKYLVSSVKTKNGYKLHIASATVDELFTFKAKLLRVIDGDTLLVVVDQGFGIWTQQRLRLNGIDAPEADTFAGQKTKQWVTDKIGKLSFIIVKTYKSDKYDRYLVDVFYLLNESDPQKVASKGRWLNAEMLKAGLAAVWNPQHLSPVNI